MGLAKFHTQRQDREGRPIHWERAAIDGVPFRGRAPLVKDEEEYAARVERECDGRAETFRMWLPDEKKALNEVIDGIANGRYVKAIEDHQYVPEHNSYVVLMIWTEPYNVLKASDTLPILGKI